MTQLYCKRLMAFLLSMVMLLSLIPLAYAEELMTTQEQETEAVAISAEELPAATVSAVEEMPITTSEVTMIQNAAAHGGSTQMMIDVDDVVCASITDYKQMPHYSGATGYDPSLIAHTLMANYPYELYWFGKTSGGYLQMHPTTVVCEG